MTDVITLRGKSLKGKNRVREHGEKWVIEHTAMNVPGKMLIRPAKNGSLLYKRWINSLPGRDPDFEIVEYNGPTD